MLIFLVRADFEYVQQFRKVFFIMFAFLMVMLSISMLIWMLNVEEVRYRESGVLKIFYQVINLSVAVCAVYIYRDRAVRLTFYGAVLINLVLIAKAFAAAGAGPAFDSIVYFFTSGGEQIGFMRNIEIHDLTYTYGLFFLYFAFMSPDAKKSRWIHSLLALFFFFSGFKRIGILAAAAATLLALVLFKISEPSVSARCFSWVRSAYCLRLPMSPLCAMAYLTRSWSAFRWARAPAPKSTPFSTASTRSPPPSAATASTMWIGSSPPSRRRGSP